MLFRQLNKHPKSFRKFFLNKVTNFRNVQHRYYAEACTVINCDLMCLSSCADMYMSLPIESKSFHFLILGCKQVETLVLFILCKFPFYRHSHDVALWFNIRDLSCFIRDGKPASPCLSHTTGGGWFQSPISCRGVRGSFRCLLNTVRGLTASLWKVRAFSLWIHALGPVFV